MHTLVVHPVPILAFKSPLRHPSPSFVFPAPSEGLPKSSHPVLEPPGIFTSTKIFLLAPSEAALSPVMPTNVASPYSVIWTLGLSLVVLFKNPR